MANSNSTANNEEDLYLTYHHLHHYYILDLNLTLKILLYIAYLIVLIVGVFGNLLVCFVVFRQASMRTVTTNLFIANLAISDILLCLFSVLFTPLYILVYKQWVFGTALCRLVPFVQGMSVYISVLTLMSIAIERYLVIIHPFQRHFTIQQCSKIIFAIWLLAFFLTLPYGIFIDVIPVPVPSSSLIQLSSSSSSSSNVTETNTQNDDATLLMDHGDETNQNQRLEQLKRFLSNKVFEKKFYCDEVWPNERIRLAFSISTSVMQFVIPFFIIAFCYLRVFLRLWDRMRNKLGNRNYSSQRQWLEKERARRTNSMLIFMVVIFVISWLPLNTYNLVEDFYLPVTNWKHSRALFMIFHLLAMSSTCYNPFLYTWLNDNFRKEFQAIFSPLINRLTCLRFIRNKSGTNNGRRNSLVDNKSANNIFPGLDNRRNSTRTTRIITRADKTTNGDGELISMTQIDTTTNMVTNLESINEAELQESLFITSLRNGVLASRIIHNNNQNCDQIHQNDDHPADSPDNRI